jgi:quercetin dioxygenase-like cupin family protein
MSDLQKIDWDDEQFVEVRPGVFGATVHTPQLTATLYRYQRGSSFEEHDHPQDQITMVLEGEIDFRVGGGSIRLRQGDLVTIAGGTTHAATVPSSGDATSLNVFTRREAPPDA